MSLIQQALEKAGKPVTGLNPPQAAKLSESLGKTQLSPRKPEMKSLSKRPIKLIFAAILLASILSGTFFLVSWLSSKNSQISDAKAIAEESVMPVKAIAKPKSKPLPSDSPYRLTGITVIGRDESIALINDLVAKKGDTLPGNALVKEIASSYVILDYRGREIRLQL